ncbi:hypothetical protein [Pseudoalteromonas sp. OANN1]|uniref:hypothetical protein n=1 Tax=Pseudoalteromonas sp. OANN1 TaxID=2954497 RepID=UPI0020981DB7|nr:hypothetical protein [Pseudoalteromonas sp. OANN1]MCO7200925.1 hypothetical protein [Pseudoalteromonas sp. OANN1]
MVQDLVKSWFSDNKVKITSPVLGAFMGAWVLFNWKHFLLLFWGKGDLEVRLTAFEKVVTWSNCSMWLWPLLVALVYAFGLPYLNVLSHKILKQAEEWRHDEVVGIDIIKAKKKAELNEELYKGDPANSYLGRKLEAELKQKDADAEKARTEANEAKIKLAEAEAHKKSAEAEQKKLEAELETEQLKLEDAKRREERENAAHELAKLNHKQQVSNLRFPTVFMFLDKLIESLQEQGYNYLPRQIIEVIPGIFGYQDLNELLSDERFNNETISQLAFVVYDNSSYLHGLQKILDRVKITDIEASELFDHIEDTLSNLDLFRFISVDLIEDEARDFAEHNCYDLIHEDDVSAAFAETNAFFDSVDDLEFISLKIDYKNNIYKANFSAVINGESDEDKGFCGDTIDVSFTYTYRPVIGLRGLGSPTLEDINASVRSYYD